MAALKSDPDRAPAKTELARVLREFEDLVLRFETGLARSLADDALQSRGRDDVRHEACRLAIAEMGERCARRQIRRSLAAAEAQGRRVEQQLHAALEAGNAGGSGDDDDEMRGLHHGYFRLYSTELFDVLGQPTDLRLGTVRFHRQRQQQQQQQQQYIPHDHHVSVELALGASFFVADSLETLPYHAFKLPPAPSLQNRGILSRRPEHDGAFPHYDSWLLFTFLGNGCLKLDMPVEMCADVYGGPLRGRENEEIRFWGIFVGDGDDD
ncbi:hypothetical protein BU23DRAFT_182370 [Bimuria novae-zelandiae CBS 107.79]|uniref:Uncharacterized protein n=1 Tax=Bimuria novae-zelandiae CBS 107.79 TaxID=1447943 RepID=A0A6A5V471_9PLEO|nr:hypothetical protein BU23DRAFT_182370 [Bimuria novae-zelandiae CBS 107.79]